MNTKFQYATVTHAVNTLSRNGFDKSFNLSENCIIYNGNEFKSQDLKIIAVYRYEGDTDPADEVTVYGLQTRSGLKGILVIGDGIYSSPSSTGILQELHRKAIDAFSAKPVLIKQSAVGSY